MKKPIIYITDFKPFHYTRPIEQQILLDYTSWLLASAKCSKDNIDSPIEAEKIFNNMQLDVDRYGVSPKYISQRELNIMKNVFLPQNNTFSTDFFPETFANLIEDYHGIDLLNRLIIYEKLVMDVIEHWYQNEANLPDDIIHATCTGYLSPSPVQKLLSQKGWSDITATHSYQMGCYGAIPPLRMAVGFLSSNAVLPKKKKVIDILHTEYSSLHFQAINSTPDQIVSMTLFGDGFIKYSVFIGDSMQCNKKGLKVLAAQDRIIPLSINEMTLIPGPYTFEMWLSKNVPLMIRDEIVSFVESLCQQLGLKFDAIKQNLIFALHPGGPRIIDHIKEKLGLSDHQIKHSKKILYKHGNMVSATLPYIWNELIEDETILPGTKIISIAFGPGITIAGFILEKI